MVNDGDGHGKFIGRTRERIEQNEVAIMENEEDIVDLHDRMSRVEKMMYVLLGGGLAIAVATGSATLEGLITGFIPLF